MVGGGWAHAVPGPHPNFCRYYRRVEPQFQVPADYMSRQVRGRAGGWEPWLVEQPGGGRAWSSSLAAPGMLPEAPEACRTM